MTDNSNSLPSFKADMTFMYNANRSKWLTATHIENFRGDTSLYRRSFWYKRVYRCYKLICRGDKERLITELTLLNQFQDESLNYIMTNFTEGTYIMLCAEYQQAYTFLTESIEKADEFHTKDPYWV
jgi:hypothetical protein